MTADLEGATTLPAENVMTVTTGEFAARWNALAPQERDQAFATVRAALDLQLREMTGGALEREQLRALRDWFFGSVLREIRDERSRQDEKWGEQNHPDGTGPLACPLFSTVEFLDDSMPADHLAELLTDRTNRRARGEEAGRPVTWTDILLEEVFEALAEEDPIALRAELIQTAAVATQWIEAIDRRQS